MNMKKRKILWIYLSLSLITNSNAMFRFGLQEKKEKWDITHSEVPEVTPIPQSDVISESMIFSSLIAQHQKLLHLKSDISKVSDLFKEQFQGDTIFNKEKFIDIIAGIKSGFAELEKVLRDTGKIAVYKITTLDKTIREEKDGRYFTVDPISIRHKGNHGEISRTQVPQNGDYTLEYNGNLPHDEIKIKAESYTSPLRVNTTLQINTTCLRLRETSTLKYIYEELRELFNITINENETSTELILQEKEPFKPINVQTGERNILELLNFQKIRQGNGCFVTDTDETQTKNTFKTVNYPMNLKGTIIIDGTAIEIKENDTLKTLGERINASELSISKELKEILSIIVLDQSKELANLRAVIQQTLEISTLTNAIPTLGEFEAPTEQIVVKQDFEEENLFMKEEEEEIPLLMTVEENPASTPPERPKTPTTPIATTSEENSEPPVAEPDLKVTAVEPSANTHETTAATEANPATETPDLAAIALEQQKEKRNELKALMERLNVELEKLYMEGKEKYKTYTELMNTTEGECYLQLIAPHMIEIKEAITCDKFKDFGIDINTSTNITRPSNNGIESINQSLGLSYALEITETIEEKIEIPEELEVPEEPIVSVAEEIPTIPPATAATENPPFSATEEEKKETAAALPETIPVSEELKQEPNLEEKVEKEKEEETVPATADGPETEAVPTATTEEKKPKEKRYEIKTTQKEHRIKINPEDSLREIIEKIQKENIRNLQVEVGSNNNQYYLLLTTNKLIKNMFNIKNQTLLEELKFEEMDEKNIPPRDTGIKTKPNEIFLEQNGTYPTLKHLSGVINLALEEDATKGKEAEPYRIKIENKNTLEEIAEEINKQISEQMSKNKKQPVEVKIAKVVTTSIEKNGKTVNGKYLRFRSQQRIALYSFEAIKQKEEVKKLNFEVKYGKTEKMKHKIILNGQEFSITRPYFTSQAGIIILKDSHEREISETFEIRPANKNRSYHEFLLMTMKHAIEVGFSIYDLYEKIPDLFTEIKKCLEIFGKLQEATHMPFGGVDLQKLGFSIVTREASEKVRGLGKLEFARPPENLKTLAEEGSKQQIERFLLGKTQCTACKGRLEILTPLIGRRFFKSDKKALDTCLFLEDFSVNKENNETEIYLNIEKHETPNEKENWKLTIYNKNKSEARRFEKVINGIEEGNRITFADPRCADSINIGWVPNRKNQGEYDITLVYVPGFLSNIQEYLENIQSVIGSTYEAAKKKLGGQYVTLHKDFEKTQKEFQETINATIKHAQVAEMTKRLHESMLDKR